MNFQLFLKNSKFVSGVRIQLSFCRTVFQMSRFKFSNKMKVSNLIFNKKIDNKQIEILMENNVIKYRCLLHQQEIVAFDLDPLIEIKERYLCMRCLTIQSQSRQVQFTEEAQQKFMEMTNKQYNNKMNQITSYIGRLSNAQNQIREFQEFFNNKISESMKILNSKISEADNELKSLTEPSLHGMQTEQDLINLSNYVNFGLTNNQTNQKKYEFIGQIQQQLDDLKLGEHLWIISNSLESIFTQSLIEEQVNLILSKESQQILSNNKQNQLNLRYPCNKHEYLFNMIYLEPGSNKQRLCCQSCYQENDLNKSNLKTILEVNSEWQTNLQKNNKYRDQRIKYFDQINNKITQLQKFYLESIQKLNEFRKNQKNKIIEIRNDSQFSMINKQLYQMEQQDIEQVAQILSFQDSLSVFQQQQIQTQQEDIKYRDKIIQELNSQRKKLLETSQDIQQCFCLKDYQEQLSMDYMEFIFLNEVFPNFLKKYSECLNQFKLVINYIKSKLDSYQIQNKNQEQNTHRETQYNKFRKIYEQLQQIQKNELKKIYQTIQLQVGQSGLTTNKIIYDSRILQNSYYIYGKSLKFSEKEKHQKIKLSANDKIATIKHRNTKSAICLCDKLIPLSNPVSVEFKINLLCQVRIGICDYMKVVEKNFCFDDQNQIGHGFYVLDNNGYTYSHHDLEKNVKKLGFEFDKDDTINIEVDQFTKQIIWRNKAKRLKYATEFKSFEYLYFCCVLYSSDIKITEVEIM